MTYGTFGLKFKVILNLVLGVSFIVSCAPSLDSPSQSLSFKIRSYQDRPSETLANSSQLSQSNRSIVAGPGGPAFALSPQYCYAVLISSDQAPAFNLGVLGSQTTAAPDPTCVHHPRILGKTFGLFAVGGELVVDLPAGFQYNVHLLGAHKFPTSNQYDSMPQDCVGLIENRMKAITSANTGNVETLLNGLIVNPDLKLIANNSFVMNASTTPEPQVVDLFALGGVDGV